MVEARALRLQRAMASFVLDEDESALEADAGRVARRQGLSVADQQAFRAQTEALLTYRELARMSLIEPLETMFPVLKALLEKDEVWDGCVQQFLEARVLRSSHYRDIAPSFLGWLATTAWGQDRWPFLLELAHVELLEVLVARFPDEAPASGLHAEPQAADHLVLEAATQIVSYAHAVHQASEASPHPESRPTHLIAFRQDDGEAQLLELTPATAAFLVRAQAMPLGEAAASLGLNDLASLFSLLRDLHRDGAIAGFQSHT
ncbi:putative DNA-binding domain-containing protein [Geothrix sp. PMB-07]|uniref:HvfC/BufC family peptide modification chaperone n=1 Tax=Geothrix sp. PMB-07 TaxID=3068640 RepID=UPI00274056FE|nr:putative DNA-binding domain-containing protein [Geothrix sp. PMB-07]WLT31565.1 putative DNA-binding domain-containing protein [Geothrix sp. PMB-07]